MRKNIPMHGLYFLLILAVLTAPSCKSKKETTVVSGSEPGQVTKTKTLSDDDKLKFQSTYYNACKEKIKGNIEIAETLFKECLKLDPQSAAAKYELASIYRFGGLYDQSLKFAREAAISESKNEWFQLLYIECLHNKRMYNEAADVYEKLIRTFPNRPDFYEELATEFIYAGKYEKALKAYDDLEKKFGPSDEVTLGKIKLLKQQKKWGEAESEMKKLIRNNPKEAQYYSFLADIYQETNQPEKAFQTYQEILKTDPENPYIHLALADYYRSLKKDDDFFKEVKIAFASEELDIDSKVKILISYYNLTEQFPQYKSQAYELCELLIKVHPKEAKSHSVYADFLYRDKKLPEARKELEQVIEFDKGKFIVWKQLLVCEMELGDYATLQKHSAEVVDLFPNQPEPYYLNGIANLKLKNYKDAIQSLKDGQEFVYENEPLQSQFLATLGETYNAVKDYEKSDKAFDEALIIDKDNIPVMNNYAYYLSLRKDKLDYAAKLSKRSIELQPTSVSYMDTYGWILYQQGNYTEAGNWIEKALSSGGEKRPAILEHYGDILYKLNEKTKALEYWQKAKDNGGNSDSLNKKIADKKLYD
jgi:tetratricopeptide (TPR) repeat protein